MRLAALVITLLFLPSAGALSESFADPAGDVRMATSDDRFGNEGAGDQWPNLDLRAGGIFAETDDLISFYLNVTDLSAQQDPPAPKSQPRYEYYFRFGFQGYRITGITSLDTPDGGALGQADSRAEISIEYDENVYHSMTDIEMDLDFTANQIVFHVDRRIIRDHNEAPLGRGESLHEMWAQSHAVGWFGVPLIIGNFGIEAGPPAFRDSAPNANDPTHSYKTQAGRQLHGGDLIAGSSDPVRWTNGEATTFVYFIRLENTGSRDLEILLGHEGADPAWQVAYSDSLTVPAHLAINITYHVAIPFGHAHGKLHAFDVTFTTVTGEDWARQPLAVYWPNIPQPAGHHNQIWMHSRLEPREAPFESLGDKVHGWWSAADASTEAYDEQVPVTADRMQTDDAGATVATWTMRLEPSLRMGLDFLLDETGRSTIMMNFPVTVTDPKLEWELVHLNTRAIIPKPTPIFTITAAETGQFDGAHAWRFDDILVVPEADLIRHGPRAELEFRFTLTGIFAGQGVEHPPEATPSINPVGTTLFLPLQEYHDPLETVFFTDASAQVSAGEGGQQKRVNPGKDTVFTFSLDYQGTFASEFEIQLSGPHSEWARALGDNPFLVEPGQVREVAIAIQPPTTAGRGDYAEVTVKLVSTRNAAIQAGLILRAEVDTSADIADEAALAAQKAAALKTVAATGPVVWPWFVIPPVVIVAAAVALYRFRPQWLFFWRN